MGLLWGYVWWFWQCCATHMVFAVYCKVPNDIAKNFVSEISERILGSLHVLWTSFATVTWPTTEVKRFLPDVPDEYFQLPGPQDATPRSMKYDPLSFSCWLHWFGAKHINGFRFINVSLSVCVSRELLKHHWFIYIVDVARGEVRPHPSWSFGLQTVCLISSLARIKELALEICGNYSTTVQVALGPRSDISSWRLVWPCQVRW